MSGTGLTKAVLKSDECDRMRHLIQRPVVLELLAHPQHTGEARQSCRSPAQLSNYPHTLETTQPPTDRQKRFHGPCAQKTAYQVIPGGGAFIGPD